MRRDADRALDVLEDISVVRRLLDQTELAAVRTARRAGRSWAEIATMLGVTRQSAWERWRDLDETPVEPLAPPPSRRRLVTVPKVILLPFDGAADEMAMAGLMAVGPDPDTPPLEPGDNDHVVTDQSPESGARVPRGSAVTLWTERRGGSGVREPRRPKVPPTVGRQLRDEESNEAVG